MSNGLNEPDEFTLVRCKLHMPCIHGTTEESYGSLSLMKDHTNAGPDASHSTMNSLVKFGNCKTGALDKACWRAQKAWVASANQEKVAFLRSFCKRCNNTTKILNKLGVVTRKTEKTTQCPYWTRLRPFAHGLYLGLIHGDAVRRNHMSKIRNGCLPEKALWTFQEELMLPKKTQNISNVVKMVWLGNTINENVIKKNKNEPP